MAESKVTERIRKIEDLMLSSGRSGAEACPAEAVREFCQLICEKDADVILDRHRDTFALLIPEIRQMFGLDQRSPYHNRDVWEHTLAGVRAVPQDPELRLTMLLHDIAKPVVFILDDNGRGRFVGHPQKGAEMAYRILNRLGIPGDSVRKIVRLIRYHDVKMTPQFPDVRRMLAVFGPEGFEELLKIKQADAAGKYEKYLLEAQEKTAALRRCAAELSEQEDLLLPEDLNVETSDLLKAGVSDEFAAEQIKERLLKDLADGKLVNEKTALLRAVEEEIK